MYFWWVDFQLKNWHNVFGNKISTRFLYELQNIRPILIQKYQLNFCASYKISGQFFNTKYQANTCNSLMNQTLWSQGTYWLEIISTCSERVCLYKFCSEDSTDFVDCWLVSNQPLRCKNKVLISVNWMPKSTHVYCRGSCCIDTSQRLVWHQSTIDRICRFLRTKFVAIGSWPDLPEQVLIISNW